MTVADHDARVENRASRQAHNLETAGSTPARAITDDATLDEYTIRKRLRAAQETHDRLEREVDVLEDELDLARHQLERAVDELDELQGDLEDAVAGAQPVRPLSRADAIAFANEEIEYARKHPPTPRSVREEAERLRRERRGDPWAPMNCDTLAEALDAWAAKLEGAT